MHGVSARLGERRGRVKDTCSAAMLEHVTLPYCRDLRSAGTYVLNAHRFSFHLHGWHTHTHEPTHTHVSRHTYTYSFHYSFPLAVHPVHCYVLHVHGFTHKLCLFELF